VDVAVVGRSAPDGRERRTGVVGVTHGLLVFHSVRVESACFIDVDLQAFLDG
jgi:hypothetical protein